MAGAFGFVVPVVVVVEGDDVVVSPGDCDEP